MNDRETLADLTAATRPRTVSEPGLAYSWLQDERDPERVALAAEKAAMIRRSSDDTRKRMTHRTFQCPDCPRTVVTVYRLPGDDGGLLAVPAARVTIGGGQHPDPWWVVRGNGPDRLRCRCGRQRTPVRYR